MAITLAEFAERLDRLEKELTDGLVKISEEAALNVKAIVVRRIQAEGVGDYSDNPLPLFFFTNPGGTAKLDKTKSNAGIKFIEQAAKDPAKKKRGITWAEIRDAEGLQTDFVDLTFTGEMFRDLHILGTNVQRGKVTTLLGASRQETINKLKWNAERYGAFFDPTPAEVASIRKIIEKRYQSLIKKVLS